MNVISTVLGDNFFIKILLIPTILGLNFLIKNTIQRKYSRGEMGVKKEWIISTTLFTISAVILKVLFVELDILSPNTNTYLLNDSALYFTAICICYMTIGYYKYMEYSVLILFLVYYYFFIYFWGFELQSSFFVILSLFLFWSLIFVIARYRKIVIKKYYLYFSISMGIGIIAELLCLSEFAFSFELLIGVLLKSSALLALNKVVSKLLGIVIEVFSELKEQSYIDELTGVSNIRKFYEVLEQLLHNKTFRHFSLALFDIDSFKSINDNYGHTAGDDVLNQTCRIIEKVFSENKVHGQVFRYGGDEFYIIIRKKANKDIQNVMEQIRLQVANHNFKYKDTDFNISLSVGVCEITEQIKFGEILNTVDEKLYSAKANGKNQIVY